jgi:hypothetical protein
MTELSEEGNERGAETLDGVQPRGDCPVADGHGRVVPGPARVMSICAVDDLVATGHQARK